MWQINLRGYTQFRLPLPPPPSLLGMGILPPPSITAHFPAFSTPSTSGLTPIFTLPPLVASSSTSTSEVIGTDPAIPTSLQVLSLPAKLILELEYVDMGELVPESWRHQDDDQKCCHRRTQRKGPVTDILLWLECYSSMVAILSSKYPDKTPQLMGYQRTIVKAHRSFTGEGWVTYDACYRRKTTFTKSLDWGVHYTMRPSQGGQNLSEGAHTATVSTIQKRYV